MSQSQIDRRPSPGPKLRSSCDSCGIAKMKCDRGRPKCNRCVISGSSCIYGVSRKAGKPSRRMVRLDQPLAARRLRVQRSGESVDSDQSTVLNVLSGSTGDFQGNCADLDKDAASLPGIASTAPGNNHIDQMPPSIFDAWPFQEWPRFGTGMISNDAAIATPDTHNCPRESYEIFRDLICPTPFLHAPESNTSTTSAYLDQVLHFNREAMDRLHHLLRCPCAQSGHRALVHASAISRILIWYQQAGGWMSHPQDLQNSAVTAPSLSSRPSTSPACSPVLRSGTSSATEAIPSPLSRSTGFRVETLPISIGTFSVEDQTLQTAFRNLLILSELKKTAKLIDTFASPESGKCRNDTMDLRTHLAGWLRTELASISTFLNSGLGPFQTVPSA